VILITSAFSNLWGDHFLQLLNAPVIVVSAVHNSNFSTSSESLLIQMKA